MEKFTLDKSIKVFCITAKSFPDGVMEAHRKLHELVPLLSQRRYFGISRPDKGVIIYKAAAEELEDGEAEKLGLEPFVIKSGEFISITIPDFAKDMQSIGRAFKELLASPDIDPDGYCLEWYLNEKDVRCMVPLKS
jgi:hypothetical protein